MKKKDFIRIINEEVGEFDFLNNEKYIKEKEIIDLLQNFEFQKQFIFDSITKMRDVIEFNEFSAFVYNQSDLEYENEEQNTLNLEITCDVKYKYDSMEEPINFSLIFLGNKVRYQQENSENLITWDEIDVDLYSIEGDKIDFTAFDKAPDNIKKLFIKSYIEDIIKNEFKVE